MDQGAMKMETPGEGFGASVKLDYLMENNLREAVVKTVKADAVTEADGQMNIFSEEHVSYDPESGMIYIHPAVFADVRRDLQTLLNNSGFKLIVDSEKNSIIIEESEDPGDKTWTTSDEWKDLIKTRGKGKR